MTLKKHAEREKGRAPGGGVLYLVAMMGRSFVNCGLIDGVGYFVWKDAGREAGHQLLDTILVTERHHVVLHCDVLAPIIHRISLHAKGCIDSICVRHTAGLVRSGGM